MSDLGLNSPLTLMHSVIRVCTWYEDNNPSSQADGPSTASTDALISFEILILTFKVGIRKMIGLWPSNVFLSAVRVDLQPVGYCTILWAKVDFDNKSICWTCHLFCRRTQRQFSIQKEDVDRSDIYELELIKTVMSPSEIG